MPESVNAKFWRDRRVFITGHTGFKGSWLTAVLHHLGAEVHGYALSPPTDPSMFTSLQLDTRCRSEIADIRDCERLLASLTAAKPDVVFHLAAQPLVRAARSAPADTFATNVMGTVHLLDAVRACPSVKAVVIVTSDKVYQNHEWAWAYRETDALGGKEPYGASKACTEIVAEAYRHSYFSGTAHPAKIATARAGNVIGGGDWAQDRLIPDAVRAFSSGDALIIRNPLSVRPWQHVLEPVAGYIRLAEALARGGPESGITALNFGPPLDDAAPVAKIADEVTRLWGGMAQWRHDAREQPYEARLLEVDSALARTRLNWMPKWRLQQALVRTMEWYKTYYLGGDASAATRMQIEEYFDV